MTDNRSRITIIALVFALLGGAVVLRLGYLQVIQHDYFAVLANETHVRKFEIPAQRGRIYMQDRGERTPVAMNRNLQTMYADTRYVYDEDRVISTLERVLGTDYSQEIAQAEGYVELESEVTYEDAQAVEEEELSGIGFNDNYTRVYPEEELGASLLGFVNHDRRGQYGVEEYLNERLSGTPGMFDARTDSQGMPLATSDNVEVEPDHGDDVTLHIDRNIQAFVDEALAEAVEDMQASSAHALVMDPDTGAVLAMGNHPTFDPNEYAEVEDYRRFRNDTVTSRFEPGSGFKIFTMATGLETGAVTPNSTYYDSGRVEVANATIANVEPGSRKRSMQDVIVNSVNTGVVHVLKQLGGGEINSQGKATLHDFFTNRFRLTEATGIEQPGEPEPDMAGPEEVGPVEYANMTFGQGITTTMVRMTASMGAVANGGTLHQPQLVDYYETESGVEEVEPQVVDKNVISQDTSRQLRKMMGGVVTDGGGYGTDLEGHRVGGKTGTAQIPDPNGGGYLANRYIGTFTGFAPLEDPEYVMMVRVDEPNVPGYAGSAAAGVVFGDIMEYVLEYKAVPENR